MRGKIDALRTWRKLQIAKPLDFWDFGDFSHREEDLENLLAGSFILDSEIPYSLMPQGILWQLGMGA